MERTNDTVIQSVVEKFISRSIVGYTKYGTTMDREDLAPSEWANHMQEELMDAVIYLEKLKRVLPSKVGGFVEARSVGAESPTHGGRSPKCVETPLTVSNSRDSITLSCDNEVAKSGSMDAHLPYIGNPRSSSYHLRSKGTSEGH